jgi:histidyl-tRNA synthetase
LDESFEINFDTLKTNDDCMNIKEIRRITVHLNSVKIPTKWFWYYQIENDKWIQHQLSDSIENAFKKFLEDKKLNHIKKLNQTNILFDKMILRNDNFEEHKLRRRPEFIEDNKNEKK